MIGTSHIEPFSSFGDRMGDFGGRLGDFFGGFGETMGDFGDDLGNTFDVNPQLAVPLTILNIFGRLFLLGFCLFVVIFFVSRYRARHRTFEGE